MTHHKAQSAHYQLDVQDSCLQCHDNKVETTKRRCGRVRRVVVGCRGGVAQCCMQKAKAPCATVEGAEMLT